MSTETLTKAEPSDLLTVISRAVSDPDLDVEKMERLLAMHERITAEQRKTAFMAALSRLQAIVPQIEKNGQIIVKGVERSRYARLEDIDAVIRPILAAEGFAFSFDSTSNDGKLHVLSCKMSHAEGHSETKTIVLPMDSSNYRSDVQSIGSTVSYARRQLIKMHLNIIERGEDVDGNSLEPISAEQVQDIEALMSEVGADEAKFLVYVGVESLAAIRERDFKRAISALESKRRQ